ncbi:GntR family transcriptional regulator [Microbacterium sp. GCS4]|nr:GntR family transcriptional regulator [Microbacterium sp. GCS4]
MTLTLDWSDETVGTAVQQQSYRAQAAAILRSQIVSGRLEAGTLLSIGSVAERLKVSITPVREALHDLAKDGLVEMRRNRGFIVRRPTPDELDQINEVRALLEIPAIRTITQRGLIDDYAPHRELCVRTRGYAMARDWSSFVATDREFHLGLLRGLGNDELVTMVGTLRDRSRLLGLDQIGDSVTFDRSLQEHDDLLEAMAAGDADRAAEIMATHLRHVRGLWAGLDESDAGHEH